MTHFGKRKSDYKGNNQIKNISKSFNEIMYIICEGYPRLVVDYLHVSTISYAGIWYVLQSYMWLMNPRLYVWNRKEDSLQCFLEILKTGFLIWLNFSTYHAHTCHLILNKLQEGLFLKKQVKITLHKVLFLTTTHWRFIATMCDHWLIYFYFITEDLRKCFTLTASL